MLNVAKYWLSRKRVVKRSVQQKHGDKRKVVKLKLNVAKGCLEYEDRKSISMVEWQLKHEQSKKPEYMLKVAKSLLKVTKGQVEAKAVKIGVER